MKNLTNILLTCFLILSLNVKAQLMLKHDSIGDFVEWKDNKKKLKSLGDTLYYEDFDSTGRSSNNFLPAGWAATDSTGQGHVWIWSDQAPGGQYSSGVTALNSPTASNGYLSLPSDFYNTPTPSGGYVAMNSVVQSGPISIAPSRSVVVEFRSAWRWCCSSSGDFSLYVSADGVNYTEVYDITVNSTSHSPTNGELFSYDVSAVLANQPTAYLRFVQRGPSHYYWMIDDLTLLEGYISAYRLNESGVDFGDDFIFRPTYTQYPFGILDSIMVEAELENYGSEAQTDLKLDLQLYHDSALNGSLGQGFIFQDSIEYTQSFSSKRLDTALFDSPKFKPNTSGYYRYRITPSSDSVNQDPMGGVHESSFVISDSVLARDRGVFVGSLGPVSYFGGGNDGDRLGVLFTVASHGELINSISIYVANDTSVIGSSIVPMIWTFDQDSVLINGTLTEAFVNNQLRGNSITITSQMLGTWINLPFNNTHGNLFLSAGKQYVMGWEQVSGAASGSYFVTGRDVFSEPTVPNVTNFIYLNGTAPSWGWIAQVAGVRANFEPSLVGLELAALEKPSFELYPNPNQGLFTLKLGKESAYQLLELRDLKGQLIRQAKLNGNQIHHFDFSDLKSGIYLISLEGESKRETQKLIIY